SVERHRTAVRPTPHADTLAVELRVLRKHLIEGRDLIFQFDSAKLMPDRRAECQATIRRSSIVHRENRKSFLQQDLIKLSARPCPPMPHRLPGGPAIHVHDQRDLPSRILRKE